MSHGIICQACGIEAPTRYVAYYQNIGALVIRFHKGVKGNLCKRCTHKFFWKFTMTNVTLGWWGYISLLVTPFFVINNVVHYAKTIRQPKVPPDARVPMLTDDAVARLNPVAGELVSRINGGEPMENVARNLATRVGVSPGQVVKYLVALAQQQRPAPQPTYGFPVQQVAPIPAIPVSEPAA